MTNNMLDRATDTRVLETGSGAVLHAGEIFKERFPGKQAVIVADTTTFEVAGRTVEGVLRRAEVALADPCIFDAADIYADMECVERVRETMARTDAVLVAVGSGTVNDLVKLASHRLGRRYMVVATAASMDGYAAFGASITDLGAKQTFSCPAPLAIVADNDIVTSAPRPMSASGYADLFAKIVAGADWILADALDVEPIDDFAFGLVQDNLKNTLSDPAGIRGGDEKATGGLIEGLLASGFAMQAHKSSRPASGADHQFSHLWDMEHHRMDDGKSPSHGFKVSIGLLASTALYEELLRTDIAGLDVERCVGEWHSRGEMERTALEMFRGSDFPTVGLTEYGAKYMDAGALGEQLRKLKQRWGDISDALGRQLIPTGKAVEMLREAGAPTLPEQIGISRRRLRESYRKALFLRRRFTVLDVADRCGVLDTLVGNIFAKGGLWG